MSTQGSFQDHASFLADLDSRTLRDGLLPKAYDYATYANYTQFHVAHYELDIGFHFDTKTVSGIATLTVNKGNASPNQAGEALNSAWPANTLTLDTLETTVSAVEVNGREAQFKPVVTDNHEVFGNGLCITLPADTPDSFKCAIRYSVSADSPGLCWLSPEQTFGKEHPYVFSQGQSILNRGLLPCQDTPSVKATYSAKITVPRQLRAVMSAAKVGDGEVCDDGNTIAYSFNMPQAIPIYLLAIAVGDIDCRSIGPRSRVWTEPSMLDAAASEFGGVTEKYIQTGERLFGPYLWDEYDILIMPPAFPWGGMENPRLTFITPTLIAGDQSLTSVLAHEISHSWFGNLVTNTNWSEFWLNEGFTTYAERRLMSEVHGHHLSDMEAVISVQLLKEEAGNVSDENLTCLRPEVKGIDPDETYNEFPYEKGYAFLKYLRSLVDSDQVFDSFLAAWVEEYKFKSVTSEAFITFLVHHFPDLKEASEKSGLEFSTWIDSPGLPPWDPATHVGANPLMDKARGLASRVLSASASELTTSLDKSAITDWHTNLVLLFIDTLVDGGDQVGSERMAELVRAFDFGSGHNAEITFRWCKLVIATRFSSEYPAVTKFMLSQGKQKFQLPLYRAIVRGGDADLIALAKDTYGKSSPSLHVTLRRYIESSLADV